MKAICAGVMRPCASEHAVKDEALVLHTVKVHFLLHEMYATWKTMHLKFCLHP